MRNMLQRLWRFLRELKRRKVYRVAAAYAVTALGLWQAAAIAAPALRLPSWTVPLVVLLSFLGFPIAVLLAWGWELTPEGVRRTSSESEKEVRLEVPSGRSPPEPARKQGVLARHSRAVTVGIAVGLLTVATFGVWTALRGPERPPPPEEEGRLGVAVFPFRQAGTGADHWVEGAPDLLTTALDGTAGLRVVDPWGLWRPLRSASASRATTPDPERATSLASEAGAHRYLLGSVVPGGDETHLNLRVYSVYREDPLETIQVVVPDPDDVGGAIRQAALRLIPVLARDAERVSVGSELSFAVTDSPQALQAYLAAREAMRRGMFDSADVAIDRALSVDSTFVLANLTAFSVKSAVQFLEGAPYTGLMEYVERAEEHSGDVEESARLRIEVARAQVETRGEDCAVAAGRLVREDSADIVALADLRYCHQAHGWQYGAGTEAVRRISDRILELDPTFVPELVARAWLAAAAGAEEEMDRWAERLRSRDSDAPVVRGTILGLEAARVRPASLDSLASVAANDSPEVWGQAFRILRARWPDRAEAFQRRQLAAAEPGGEAGFYWMEGIRGHLARGAVRRVDSALSSGRFPDYEGTARRWLVAAHLAGLGDRSRADSAAEAVAGSVPVDSATALFERRPVWRIGWLVAAHEALWGDTAVTRRWQSAIGELPAGGTPLDYRGSLQSDLDARLALRRGDSSSALDPAREAFRLWSIHPSMTYEADAEPAMRLLLGELHRAGGRPDSAHAMFRSLVPPTTWLGFLTTRAWYELGELEMERGRPERAARYLEPAVRYLEGGDPDVVGPYLARARELLAAARDRQ